MIRASKSVINILLGAASLALLLDVAETQGSKAETGLDFNFTYRVTIDKIPDEAQSVQIWLPLPADNGYQQVVSYKVSSALPYELNVEPEYGNRILRFSSAEQIPDALEITVDINIIRCDQNGWILTPTGVPGDEPDLERYLQPDSLVPIDGPVMAEAKRIVNDSMTPAVKAEALYYHLFETMKYDKSGVGWGRGDALYACDIRKGNCTDIHSLFIGMARSQNIPARFVIGFPLPPGDGTVPISGYHCWAEFYLHDQGWVPVDISEAIKHPERKDYFFGDLDRRRVAFSTGRDIELRSGDSSHEVNYLVYPYILVDGQPFDKFSNSFSYTVDDLED